LFLDGAVGNCSQDDCICSLIKASLHSFRDIGPSLSLDTVRAPLKTLSSLSCLLIGRPNDGAAQMTITSDWSLAVITHFGPPSVDGSWRYSAVASGRGSGGRTCIVGLGAEGFVAV
jgi:hypothetical protein